MRATREIYDALPDTIPVPEHLRHRRVENITLPLDEAVRAGWPPGFFEATAGGWQGEALEGAAQGDFEQV